jgi:hypothetical protein
MLREIFDTIVPGKGGQFRPCDYFDLIGASGPNALCALLFVRFVSSFSNPLYILTDSNLKAESQYRRGSRISRETLSAA